MAAMATDTPSPNSQSGISQHQTNVRHSTVVQSPSSATSHPSLNQDVMKTQMLREVQRATFLVDLTAEGAPFHVDWDAVQLVLGRLRDHHGTTSTSLFSNDDSSVDIPRFPPGGFQKEKISYIPLTHFLNAIVSATNHCLPPSPRYLGAMHFLQYGREMKDIFNSQRPLKPDALGLFHLPTPPKQNFSWNEVAIIAEVKEKISDLLQQLATYARCYLAADRRRSFAPAIGFSHKSLQMFFFAFHRSGISSSGPISLKSPEGFQTAVKYMVGILSIQDEEAFGLDMTRREKVYRINDRDYRIVRPICVRHCVRGRATAVYSLKSDATGGQDNPVGVRSRKLVLANGVTELPDRIVYKLSYQTEGHTSEGPLFSKFLGQFGIIDMVGFRTCGPEEPFGNTEYLLQNASFWDFSQSKGETGIPIPEKRYLQCTAMSFECLPLLDTLDEETGIPTPTELLETILHAMIGHYNLFLDGVLHRDVSHGNILRLREPIERSGGLSADVLRSVLGQDVNRSKCRGFLIDGDHSIEWRKSPPASTLERSGTLPFMSTRLLFAWNKNKPTVHTAVDDLESFLWVLVWVLVHILKKFETTGNSSVSQLAEWLSSYYIPEIMMRESTIQYDWMDVVFGGLVQEWFAISKEAGLVVKMHVKSIFGSGNDVGLQQGAFDRLEEYCKTVYMGFIRAGYKHLESIRQYSDWKAVVEAIPEDG